MLVNGLATDMILSPQHIVDSSDDFHSWTQVGFSGDTPGSLVVRDVLGHPLLELSLWRQKGLYYCKHTSLGLDDHPVHVRSFTAPPVMPDLRDDNDTTVRPTIQALRSICTQGDNPLDNVLPFDGSHVDPEYFVAAATVSESATNPKRAKKDKPPPKSKYCKRPVVPA